MKKFASLLLALVFICTMLFAFSLSASAEETTMPSGGGTQQNPYSIKTMEDMNWFLFIDNNSSTYEIYCDKWYELAADIGDKDHPVESYAIDNFKGHFNGNGHTVWTSTCLFSCLEGGEITNVKMCGNIYQHDTHKGGICDYNKGGTISDCVSNVNISYLPDPKTQGNIEEYFGGICGINAGGRIDNCTFTGSITVHNSNASRVGGICGINSNAAAGSVIVNCVNKGSLSNFRYNDDMSSEIGGICAVANNGTTIANCCNLGTVIGNGKYVGGICGDAFRTSKTVNCYSIGKVTGGNDSAYISGICGNRTGSNCYYEAGTVFRGDTQIENTTEALTKAQMTAQAGETAEGKESLVDLLNGYRENNVYPSGFNKWSNSDNSGYPEFVGVSATGSILSGGNIWITVIIAAVVLAGIAALIIIKKKKKPATAGGENTDEE